MMTKYYKDTNNQLYANPIVANHTGLIEVTLEQFNEQLAINNTPTTEQLEAIALSEAQAYLSKTDHKFYNGYKAKASEDLLLIEALRDEARELIRESEVKV